MGEPRTRSELEALAFGADAAPDERAAALRALGYAAPPAPAPAGRPGAPDPADLAHAGAAERDEAVGAGPGGPGGEPPVPAGQPGRRWPLGARIGLGVGLVAAGAVAGFAIGAGGLNPARNLSDSPGPPLTTVESAGAAADGGTTVGSGPSPTTDAATAAAQADFLLLRARSKGDVYPFPPDDVAKFIPSSTRLEVTTAAGDRVWIARRSGAEGGYCLLTTTGSADSVLTGASGCVSPSSFGTQGMTMITDELTVTWSGGSVTVEPGAAG